jgi:predicted HTH transcriptional regulator
VTHVDTSELPGEDASNVMKTIAAFANGQGGTLLFGVTNEQQIIGRGDALSREAIDHLTRLISDHVQPHPPFEVQTIPVSDAKILAIYVWPGTDTPYGVGTSDRKLISYVRRSGNSSPARPEDIRNSVRSRMPTDNGQQGGLL